MSCLTSSELRDLTLSVGTHRSDRRLSPVEVALLLERMIECNSTRQECATLLGVSVTQVSSFLRLLTLDPQVQHLADWRGTRNASIPFSTLAELARLDADEQVRAARAILRHGLTWKEVVQLVQIRQRSKEELDNCTERVLSRRMQVKTRHLFIGVISSDSDKSHLRSIVQGARDLILGQILDQLLGSHYRAQSRLGIDSFTILSDHDLPRLLGLTPDGFEKEINDQLQISRRS